MVDRALRGDSIYSITQWLDEVGAPLPKASQRHRKQPRWRYSTVERLLRGPILAGMTPFNPGNRTHVRGREVIRGPNGLPLVDESVAIMSVVEFRRLLDRLDHRDSPQARPRLSKNATTALLSRVATCGECDRMICTGKHPRSTISSSSQLPSVHQSWPTGGAPDQPPAEGTGLRAAAGTQAGRWRQLCRVARDRRALTHVSGRLMEDDADEPALLDQLTDETATRRGQRTRPAGP